MALDLEEQQYVLENVSLMRLTQIFRRNLRLEVSKMTGTQTNKQLADLEEKRTSLRSQIQRWRQAQLVYMPCVASLVAQSPTVPFETTESSLDATELLAEPAESISLHIPSSLPQHLRQLPGLATLLEKESRLRIAQADDTLAGIRRQRRIISG